MNKKRIIARIDVKNEHVIKGIHLEGLRKVGNPNEMAKKYYNEGIDEIIFMDAVAAYYDRNSLTEIINRACENVFVPITVGGGIRKIKDIQIALNAGADKIAINTQAVKDSSFLTRASEIFGSQCIVSSIDAKKISDNKWEVYVDNGREPTGMDVVEWAEKVKILGAGEIMLTSIDKEGTKRGFDIELYNAISKVVTIPIICCGGAGKKEHIADVISNKGVDAVALASILHYNMESINNLKEFLINNRKNHIRL